MKQRRYTIMVVTRAREHHDAGWTPTEIRRLLVREFGPDCSPTLCTIRRWFDPEYAERQAQLTKHKSRASQLACRTRKMRELYSARVPLASIGRVAGRHAA